MSIANPAVEQIHTPSPAKFISFEGIDGAGKSTHIPFVKAMCEQAGKRVVLTREPGGTPLGEELRQILLQQHMSLETEAMLMFAARRENIVQVIQPALARGDWVITDRYLDSTLAYQGGGRQMAQAHLQALSEIAVGTVMPDLTLLFDVPLEVAQQRLAKARPSDKFEREQAEFFNAVRQRYLDLAQQAPQRIHVIDASGTIAEIELQVKAVVQAFLTANGLVNGLAA
jgi:dTMP kinase